MMEGVSCVVLEAGSNQELASVGLGCQSSLSLRERLRLGFLLHACRAEKDRLSVIDPVPGGVFAGRSLAPAHHLAGIHYSVVGQGTGKRWHSAAELNLASKEKIAMCELGEAGRLENPRTTSSYPG